jgi:hypothetical protein
VVGITGGFEHSHCLRVPAQLLVLPRKHFIVLSEMLKRWKGLSVRLWCDLPRASTRAVRGRAGAGRESRGCRRTKRN